MSLNGKICYPYSTAAPEQFINKISFFYHCDYDLNHSRFIPSVSRFIYIVYKCVGVSQPLQPQPMDLWS